MRGTDASPAPVRLPSRSFSSTCTRCSARPTSACIPYSPCGPTAMSEDAVLPIPNLGLAQNYFVLSTPSLDHLQQDARKELLEGIQADRTCISYRISLCQVAEPARPDMAPYYRIITATSALDLDEALLARMEKENKEELDKIEERLEEAKKTEGETDIADALRARANYLTRIGDKVRKAYYAARHALPNRPPCT